jgi:hypothetical protein
VGSVCEVGGDLQIDVANDSKTSDFGGIEVPAGAVFYGIIITDGPGD